MTDRREMHADLVGATGFELALEEGAARQLELFDDLVLRSRGLARVIQLSPAATGASFTALTVIATVATFESAVPSFALYVKLSGPL